MVEIFQPKFNSSPKNLTNTWNNIFTVALKKKNRKMLKIPIYYYSNNRKKIGKYVKCPFIVIANAEKIGKCLKCPFIVIATTENLQKGVLGNDETITLVFFYRIF